MTIKSYSRKVPENRQLTSAKLAAAAGLSPTAGEKKTKMASSTQSSIFDTSSVEQLQTFKNKAKEGLNSIVADHSEGSYYVIPEKILNNLEPDVSKQSKANKEAALKNAEKTFAYAIAELTKHMLGFIVPGQILTIAMLDEIRYENKQLKKQLNELNFKKSQESESREEFSALTKELISEVKSSRAEIQEIRNVVFQLKSRDNQETAAPKAANSNNPKKSKARKSGPSPNLNPDGNPIPGLNLETGTSSNRNVKENKSNQDVESMDAFNDWNENNAKEN